MKWGGAGGLGRVPHVLVPKNTFTDVLDFTCDISDFRAHFSCPQTTPELPKKYNEPPEQLPTAALSQIDLDRSSVSVIRTH